MKVEKFIVMSFNRDEALRVWRLVEDWQPSTMDEEQERERLRAYMRQRNEEEGNA